MATDAIPRCREIRVVVPTICKNVFSTVATTREAVSDDGDSRGPLYDLMARCAEALFQHDGRVMMSVCQAIPVTLSTFGFSQRLVSGIKDARLLRHIIHRWVGTCVGSIYPYVIMSDSLI